MKLKANHVTLARIVCLPIPCYLMYGGTAERVIALLLFVILGLTDYIDGIMARREGSTPLGKLLDPIADKIFLAVTFIPLVQLDIMSLWIVWPIFFREFLVTELRRFLTGRDSELKVTDLAKLKTTLQMTGFGLILFNVTFPDKLVSISILATAIFVSLAGSLAMIIKRKTVDIRLKKAASLCTLGLVVLLFCTIEVTNIIYGLIILGITFVSGWQYVRIGLPVCLKRGWKSVLSLAVSIAVPLTALLQVDPSLPCSTAVIIILSIEFAVQGFDMWAMQENYPDISKYKKQFVVPAALIMLSYGAFSEMSVQCIFLNITLCLCLTYAMYDFYKRRELFIKGV